MLKRLAIGLMFGVLSATAVQSQAVSLDQVCLISGYDSLVGQGAFAGLDSILGLLDTVTVTGTCDSIAVGTMFGTIPVVLASVKKMNSCSLFIDYTIGTDTVINVCELLPIDRKFIPRLSAARGGVALTASGTMLALTGTQQVRANDLTVKLFNEQGKCLAVLDAAAGRTSWQMALPNGSALYTILSAGRTIAAGRVTVVR